VRFGLFDVVGFHSARKENIELGNE